jgi:hypothetical protein
MLTKQAVLSTIGLSIALAEQGKVAVAKPNTIVSELVRLTNAELASTVSAVGDDPEKLTDISFEGFAEMIERTSAGTLEKPSEHDKTLDAYIDDISKYVTAHLSFARNVVKPIVVEYDQIISSYMANYKPPSAADSFNIEVRDIPEILKDKSFFNSLDAYDSGTPLVPDQMPKLGQKTDEQLIELIKLGEQDADEAIVAWYTRKGDAFLQSVWNSFFADPATVSGANFLSYDAVDRMEMFDRIDVYLAMYLFSTKIYSAVDDSAEGMTLTTYQNILAQTRDYAGTMIRQLMTQVSGMLTAGLVVLDINQPAKSARVFAPNYRAWLEAGGQPETVLGLIVDGRRANSIVYLQEAQVDLLAKWSDYRAFHEAVSSNAEFDSYRDVLVLKFRELMSGLAGEEKTFVDATPDYFDRVNTVLTNEIGSLVPSDMKNTFEVAMRIICRARFYYTDAEVILNGIMEASKVNPNIDPRQAALISTINYVADYVADQLTMSIN